MRNTRTPRNPATTQYLMMEHFAGRPFRMYAPVPLLEELSGKLGPDARYHDQFLWILSSTLHQQLTDKRYDREDYVPLHQVALREIVSKRKLQDFIEHLKDWGMLDQDRSWQAGEYSMGYRLGRLYRHEPIQAYNVQDMRMLGRINEVRQRQYDAIQQVSGHAEVNRWLHELEIEGNEAHRYLTDEYPGGGKAFDARWSSVDRLAHRQYFYSIDGTAGRGHHNLSSLGSNLRPFLRINGQPLVQVDITNSQPLFFHLVASNTHNIASTEVALMAQLVEGGTIYEVMKLPGMTRDQSKTAMYQMLYGRGNYSTDYARKFESMLPGYAQVARDIKGHGHAQLAIHMQRLEAELIYENVPRFVQEAGPNAPILTIHDSYVTTGDYVTLATQSLVQGFSERYGILPPTRIEHFGTT